MRRFNINFKLVLLSCVLLCIHSVAIAQKTVDFEANKNLQYLNVSPLGWAEANIGTIKTNATTLYKQGKYAIKGGVFTWKRKQDGIYFVYKHDSASTELIAKIEKQQSIDENAKAGVMIRQSLHPSSVMAIFSISPSNTVQFGYRLLPNTNSNLISSCNIKLPVWVRLVYKDGYACGYHSTNGKNWIKVGRGVPLNLQGSFLSGIGVSSQVTDSLCSVYFDSVKICKPTSLLLTKDAGQYFSQKKYINHPIPIFATDSVKLPQPILDGNKEWIDLYWKSWKLAFSHIKRPVGSSPFVSNWYDEWFNNDIFQWDIIFMSMFGRYGNHVFPAVTSFDNFYICQHESGLICRQINESTGLDAGLAPVFINPPLFSWAEIESFQLSGDKNRFAMVLPVLEKYIEYLELENKCWNTKHQLYRTNGYASGMDNTPRDNGRIGGHSAGDEQGWVDMSCQMVLQYKNIAKICSELGYIQKATSYQQKANEITDRINQFMWNEKDGLYYDVNTLSEQTNHKTSACFWPLLAGITSKAQEARLIENLTDTTKFWRPVVFPTLAADQPEYKANGFYWLGGVWAPTNYAIIKGLDQQGYHDLAKLATEKYLTAMSEVYKTTGTIWENYAPEKIASHYRQGTNDGGVNDCRPDFVGWSGLGPISLLIEEVIGVHADAIHKTIVWNLKRNDRNGIRNLQFGDIVTDIIANGKSIEVKSNAPYTLIVNDKKFKIKKGLQNISYSTHYLNQ